MCTMKQVTRQAKRVHAIFLVIVRPAKKEPEEKGTEGTDEEKMYHEEMPDNIKAVLQKFKDIFPSDLPSGVPPVHKGHRFRIDLEDDVPPMHWSIYKLSPLELEEARKQIGYML